MLPYSLKPKYPAQNDAVTLSKISKEPISDKSELVKRCTAVILEPEESRIHDFMNVLKTIKNDRDVKEASDKKKRSEKHAKVIFYYELSILIFFFLNNFRNLP